MPTVGKGHVPAVADSLKFGRRPAGRLADCRQPLGGPIVEADQKLGLLAGVAGVLVVAVVYFGKPPQPLADPPRPAAVDAAPLLPPASVGVPGRPARTFADD